MDASYFDPIIDRSLESGSYSHKVLSMADRYQGYDLNGVIPMWVADMDFRCPPQVIEAVKARADHGLYGYTGSTLNNFFLDAAAGWAGRRYGWTPEPGSGIFVPGIVPAINAAIQEFTQLGDGVIIQSPVYYPFTDGTVNNGRIPKHNTLIEGEDGYYQMDFQGLEELASDPNTKLLVLCNPHNPVGRVWTREELSRLFEICAAHDVIVFSDEIHADLVMSGHPHVTAGSLGERFYDRLIVAYAPSKTFNLAGLGASAIFVPDPALRARLQKRISANRLPPSNVFGPLAGAVAYNNCDDYVDTLVPYLEKNIDYVVEFVARELPGIKLRKPEGTYMIWLDLRGLGMTPQQINDFMIEKAKIAVDFGTWFGVGGDGFVRMNLASPFAVVQRSMAQLKAAVDALPQD